MSKISKAEPEDDLQPEYHIDYSKARLNPYAKLLKGKGSRIIVLEPDVAKVFTSSEEVNKLLRGLIQTMPVKASKTKRKAS